jgi:hypothetical protein
VQAFSLKGIGCTLGFQGASFIIEILIFFVHFRLHCGRIWILNRRDTMPSVHRQMGKKGNE